MTGARGARALRLVTIATCLLIWPPAAGAAGTITVSPVVVDRTLAQDSVTRVDVQVSNQSDHPFAFGTQVRDFTGSKDPGSDRQFVEGNLPRGARAWTHVSPSRFSLAAGQEQTLTVSFTPGRNVEPGGHYCGLFVIAQPRGGTVSISTRIGVLMFLTLPGDVRHDLTVDVTPRRSLSAGSSSTWTATFRNDGTVHERIAGSINLTGLLTHRRAHRIRPMFVLPGTRREVTVTFPDLNLPDRISATFTGSREVTIRAARRHDAVTIPWWSILALALMAAAAVARLATGRQTEGPWDSDLPDLPDD